MTQQKRPSTPQGPFGLTVRDIVLLAALVSVLALGLILLAYQRAQPQPKVATSIAEGAAIATSQPSPPSPTETRVPTPTNTPTEKPTATPTETSTSTPTTEPTEEPTPTNTPGPAPTVTPEPAVEPTQASTAEPTQTATIEPTATPTSTPTFTPTPTDTVTVTPNPPPATIAYVQNSSGIDTLSLITSAGTPFSRDLPNYAAAPAWSPDGTKIAFFGEPDIRNLGNIYQNGEGVYIIDAQQKVTQLAKPRYLKNMVWSPDGTKLAYENKEPDQPSKVVVIDSGQVDKQLFVFDGQQPAWKPDNSGRMIIKKSCTPECGLWEVNASGGGNPIQITSDRDDSFPAWSPDGQRLVFSSNRDGDWEIYRVASDGSDLKRLTDQSGEDTTPVFNPDGQEIYWLSNRDGSWKILAMRLDGSGLRVLKDGIGHPGEWGLARPAVH